MKKIRTLAPYEQDWYIRKPRKKCSKARAAILFNLTCLMHLNVDVLRPKSFKSVSSVQVVFISVLLIFIFFDVVHYVDKVNELLCVGSFNYP